MRVMVILRKRVWARCILSYVCEVLMCMQCVYGVYYDTIKQLNTQDKVCIWCLFVCSLSFILESFVFVLLCAGCSGIEVTYMLF